MRKGIIILYAIWAVVAILTFICSFCVPMALFWKVVLWSMSGLNLLGIGLNIPQIVESIKNKTEE